MSAAHTYLATLSSTSAGTTYDFGDVVVPRDGVLVVGGGGSIAENRSVASVSIGGVAATICATAGGIQAPCAIAALAVTAGTHNVSVTFSGSMARAAVSVYLIEGVASATPDDTDSVAAASGTAAAVTLDFPTGGLALYFTTRGAIGSITWSAASEDYDAATSLLRHAAAHKSGGGTGDVETITSDSNISNGSCGAVWAPAGAPAGRLKRVGYNGGFATPYNGGLAG